MKIPKEMNKRWIRGLHEGIGLLGEDIKLGVLSPAAAHCAADIVLLCEEYVGKTIDSVDDLISGWNMLRNDRGLTGNWVSEGETIRAVFGECGCPLIRSGLVELHPLQCYCSQNMMERVFSHAAKRAINVKIERSIGRGDSVCEFLITYAN